MTPKIIFEDDNIIVLEKPAGLLVHPTHRQEKDTLVDWLLEYYPDIKSAKDGVGEDPNRPGIVHRLDRDTSGLLVIAKNNNSFKSLKEQFASGAKSLSDPQQEKEVTKKYLALVVGHPKEDKGTITKTIGMSRKDYRKRTTLLDEYSKKAWTEYEVIKKYKNYSLLEVTPKTGRTHQIRIHLSSIGHPLAGDKQYKFKRQICPKGLDRHFLHAKYLKFYQIDGRIMEFNSELPKDLKAVIDQLN